MEADSRKSREHRQGAGCGLSVAVYRLEHGVISCLVDAACSCRHLFASFIAYVNRLSVDNRQDR
jgi:hypothetical protein